MRKSIRRSRDFDGASHGVDRASELHKSAVACALHHAPVVDSNRRVEKIAAESAQPRERTFLVRTG
jgi:hypothetical protein